MCGGTLIGTKHVITAAHCVDNDFIIEHVVVGEHDQRMNDGEQNITVSGKPIFHPKYFVPRDRQLYDVAILVLQKRVDNKFAEVALLPQPNETFNRVDVSGWGLIGPPSWVLSDILRTVKLDVLSAEDPRCFRQLRTPERRYSLLCGEDLQDISRGTCGGDSGGTNKYSFYNYFKSIYEKYRS